ncbi:MAG TPA: NADPH-dependent 7-cyano-7-deazaguanine reductase QueF [Arenimonas sp.]|uniref:NADPH-dependent 7-cyano-7-deazaguanine reductase QueF n=1 Tax=Arenimonas sp. TaxID=1872635 RepID=UPI002CE587C0|nr:NADPH-dependent 7-cyano-7-deazaguanine reductase QueF [Arenimonas sp.]HMB56472.1 NADPH-dependent 7-cyano-7-deazaguanine reductase QueF [Arenimonas sp.]
MNPLDQSSLGKAVVYGGSYDPALLFPIARAEKRSELGIGTTLPFIGIDIWNAFELSWLDARGKPRVVIAEFRVPAESPNIIESKSFKLYLNSYMQTRVPDTDTLRSQLSRDLSAAAGAPVSVVLTTPTSPQAALIANLAGEVIDDLPLEVSHYGPPRADFLYSNEEAVVEETLVSHLLKSNCPVTGQPDWASLQIRYVGPRLGRDGLLRYLVSYREHNDFHEQCVERVFMDIRQRCAPSRLSVYARYTRRGGLDINPFRCTPGWLMPDNTRTSRQ